MNNYYILTKENYDKLDGYSAVVFGENEEYRIIEGLCDELKKASEHVVNREDLQEFRTNNPQYFLTIE